MTERARSRSCRTTNTYFRIDSSGSGNIGFGQLGQVVYGQCAECGSDLEPSTFRFAKARRGDQSIGLHGYVVWRRPADDRQSPESDATGGQALDRHQTSATTRTARNQTIDQGRFSTINTKLQHERNDPTPREHRSGERQHGWACSRSGFLSNACRGFQVFGWVRMQAATGINGLRPGNVAQGTTLGTGLTASVDSQTNAEAAVNALRRIRSPCLGSAQSRRSAVGENQFTYAVNPRANTAVDQSRFRRKRKSATPTSLPTPPNLTKAQILVQAGVARHSRSSQFGSATVADAASKATNKRGDGIALFTRIDFKGLTREGREGGRRG